MSWNKLGLLFVVFLGASVLLLASEDQPVATGKSETEAALMRAKLASSQKILEGLMTQDFGLIENGGRELAKICEATQWHAKEDQVYAHYRDELRRSSQKLVQLAEDEDQDGATYTYMHSITTCTSCHDYCRDVLHLAAKEPMLQAIPTAKPSDDRPERSFRR
jgi:hypothetical protein